MIRNKNKPRAGTYHRKSLSQRIWQYRYAYLMLVPVAAYFIIFHFLPMGGIVIAFKDYRVNKGIWGSDWVGFKHFITFFRSRSFESIIRNSIVINIISILFAFPMGIIFAIFLNEVTHTKLKKVIQTITYLPHFISVVVLCSLIHTIFSDVGVLNQLITRFGGEAVHFLTSSKWYYALYVGSDIWQHTGWNSIIYLAAIAGISPELYEAAQLDGANWFQRTRYVTLPGIITTVLVMLIMRVGNLLTVGLEKTLLLQNAGNSEVSNVLSAFVYQKGLIDCNYGYSTAVNLFNSVVALVTLAIVNHICKKHADVSVW